MVAYWLKKHKSSDQIFECKLEMGSSKQSVFVNIMTRKSTAHME
jgi:hypothetical protein